MPQSTVKSILNGESQNPDIVTIKKLCDGLEISLADFFDAAVFQALEQEIESKPRVERVVCTSPERA
ncbi:MULTISPECIES: helix-turn-helix domain-containing protein [Acutalibacteraceae]|uniref:helix-turn-helix domain-containing protein n=1 Tax=Acutalibacteraceae TaxID=3082771 RepID=UPI002E0F46AB